MFNIKKILIFILIVTIAVLPFTHAFLDVILDALKSISDALDQLELLTTIKDLQQIQSDISEFERDFREIQREVTNSVSIVYRWLYFTTTIKNQNLSDIVKRFTNGKSSEYDNILNMMYGGFGTIRANPEYAKTADNITTILGKVRTSDNANKDPDTYAYLNNVIAATDNVNQAGNMSEYAQYYAGKMEGWALDCSKAAKSDHTSTEALLKCLVNFNIYQIDFYKGQYAFYTAQMRKNYADSYSAAQIIRDNMNQRRNTTDSGKYLFEKYFRYQGK